VGQGEGFLDGGVGGFELGLLGVEVVIGTDGQGHAPVSHGELGVQLGGLLEGAVGLVVVEGEDEPQPLVEELLGLGVLGGDGVVGGAQTIEQDGGFLGGAVLGQGGGRKETKGEE